MNVITEEKIGKEKKEEEKKLSGFLFSFFFKSFFLYLGQSQSSLIDGHLSSESIVAGFSKYSFQRVLKEAMVAPSMTL